MKQQALFRFGLGAAILAISGTLLGIYQDGPRTTHAASLVVTTTADAGAGSLRQAILDANANPGLDIVSFNILPSGIQTIAPVSPLPVITDPLTIDGTTQPGWASAPIVELAGGGAGVGANGLEIHAGSSLVKGLVINGFGGSGVLITLNGGDVISGNYIGSDTSGTVASANADGVTVDVASGNTIGGSAPGSGNLISGNLNDGLNIGSGTGNHVEGNHIGTDVSGTGALGNQNDGVFIASASATRIGGTAVGSRNVISGNYVNGIEIVGSATGTQVEGNFIGANVNGTGVVLNHFDGVLVAAANNTIGGAADARNVIGFNASNGVEINGPGATGNLVQSNYLGVDVTGALPLGNGESGVFLGGGASSNTIGGPGRGNVISGNSLNGVRVEDAGTTGNQILSNLIGTQADGFSQLFNGNDGVFFGGISAPNSNAVGGTGVNEGNVIAGNLGNGVHVQLGTGESILSNAIFNSGFVGIRLGPGGNNSQKAPHVLAAGTSGGTTAIQATLTATAPSASFRLEIFDSPACNPSGFGEGRTFIAATTVMTNVFGNGFANLVVPTPLTIGHVVTATATSVVGNTSEFSACLSVNANLDTDFDGCPDGKELGIDSHLGGQRDPTNPWDFADVPVPALLPTSTTGVRNKIITLSDVLSDLAYVGTSAANPNSANAGGAKYGSDINANGLLDGQEYDRTPSTTPGQPWRSGPPNGVVSLSDVLTVLAQVGTNCN